MTTVDENYDYTQEQTRTYQPTSIIVPDDFSPDEVEAGSFENLEPGQYRLVSVGYSELKQERKEFIVDGHRVGVDTFTTWARFGLPEARAKQASDHFMLMPEDPDQIYAFVNGLAVDKNGKVGKQKGFFFKKLFHMVERLIPGAVQAGKPVAAEYLDPANWVDREIVATVEGGTYEKEIQDPETGEMKKELHQGKSSIKLFSYREAGTAVTGPAQPTAMRAPGTPAGPNGMPRAAAPAPAPVQRPAAPTPQPVARVPQQQPRSNVAPMSPAQAAPGRPQGRQPVAANDRGLGNI